MVRLQHDKTKTIRQIRGWHDKRVKDLIVQVEKSARKIEGEAKHRAPVGADGALRASIGVKRKQGGLAAEIGTGVLGGKELVYAEAVEFGRKPGGFPPWKENTALLKTQ